MSVVVRLVCFGVALTYGAVRFAPLLDLGPPAVMPSPRENAARRYGIPLEKRQELFSTIARTEAERIEQAKKRATSGFGKKLSFERSEARLISAFAIKNNLHPAVVFALFHEGICKKWQYDPGAEPLSARPVF